MRARWLLAAALAAGAGCETFPTPAELDHAQILAIQAEPPILPAGGRARLRALVADATGEVALPGRWAAVGLVPEAPVLGRVEVDGDGAAWFVAPDELPGDEPALAVVELTVDHPERTLIGIKGLGVGLPATANPALTALVAGGAPVEAGAPIRVAAGAELALAIEVEPAPTEATSFAWYATAGEIDPYRQPVTTITAPDQPGAGWVFVVVRDGAGGVSWRSARLDVE